MQTKVTSCEMTAMVKKGEAFSSLQVMLEKHKQLSWNQRHVTDKGEKTILTFCDMLTDFLD